MYRWAHDYCGKMVAVETNDVIIHRTEHAQEIRKGEVQCHNRPGWARRKQHDDPDGGRDGQNRRSIHQI